MVIFQPMFPLSGVSFVNVDPYAAVATNDDVGIENNLDSSLIESGSLPVGSPLFRKPLDDFNHLRRTSFTPQENLNSESSINEDVLNYAWMDLEPAGTDWNRELSYSARHLFPIAYEWPELGTFARLFGIISMPIVFVLNATVPVVHKHHVEAVSELLVLRVGDVVLETNQEVEHDYPKLVLYFQLLAAPIAVTLLTGNTWNMIFGCPLIAWGVGAGALISTLGILLTKNKPVVAFSVVITIIGFTVSIFYIMAVTDQLVALIAQLGEMFGIADSVMGLSLFALGNSLPDIVSNLSLAKRGSRTMALAACIGGPALSIYI